MRILHLDSGREMRGGQWQVLYLLRGLRDLGYGVRLLARGALLDRARSENFDAAGLTLGSIRGDADIVHAHDAKSHTLAAMSRSLGRIAAPVIVARRVAFPVKRGLLSRWKYACARHYIAISHHVAGELDRAGIKSESVSVVYDGVPPGAGEGLAPGTAVIAPATADRMKGSDLVRQAAAFAGVEVLFSSDLQRDIQKAGLFVYISQSEGLGSAALLAMAHGVPVVASRVGGLPEAVADGETGLLVENNPAEIASAIRALVDDEPLRLRMGKAARERAARQFTLAEMVEGTVGVYNKVRG